MARSARSYSYLMLNHGTIALCMLFRSTTISKPIAQELTSDFYGPNKLKDAVCSDPGHQRGPPW